MRDVIARITRRWVIPAAVAVLVTAGSTRAQQPAATDPAQLVAEVLPGLGAESIPQRQEAQQKLQTACWNAARPGAENERRALCAAIAVALDPKAPDHTLEWLVKQLERDGRAEAVPALANLLKAGSPDAREYARRALANNPAPEAGTVLREALAGAQSPAQAAAFVRALTFRKDTAAGPLFAARLQSPDDDLKKAAARALAELGAQGRDLYPTLDAARKQAKGLTAAALRDACLLMGDRSAEDGNSAFAAEIFRTFLNDADESVRCAALVGLGHAAQPDDLATVFSAMEDADARIRGAARMALAEYPADRTLPAVKQKLANASPLLRESLLRALADSGDPDALPIFLEAARAADTDTRLAAFDGMARLGSPKAAPVLIARVLDGNQAVADGARNALALIPGDEVVDALETALKGADATGRTGLAGILVTRPSPRVPGILMALAGTDPDAKVRTAAWDGLAKVAGTGDLPALAELLLKAPRETEREGARKAIVAVSRRAEDPDACATVLLNTLAKAGGDARAPILRALGRVGGKRALEAVNAAWKDPDADIRDAALRALCDWPDATVNDDLLAIAGTGDSLLHRALAMRGLVRITSESTDLDPDAKMAVFEKALATAPRDDEKKLVLGGLAVVAHPRALAVGLQALEQPALREEAAVALTQIGESLKWAEPAAVEAAMTKVGASSQNETVRNAAAAVVDSIRTYEGYARTWLRAGPYAMDGKSHKDLFDVAFPPEDAAASGLDWVPTTTSAKPEMSWFVPLDEILGGGNRVAYLKTWVYAPQAMAARVEMGSDDGLKAWLNGKVIAADNDDRAVAAAQSTADVRLEAGWNAVLLKVVQGGGQWAGAARVRKPDGNRAPELVLMDAADAADRAAEALRRQPGRAADREAALDIVRVGAASPDMTRKLLAAVAAGEGNDPLAKTASQMLERMEATEDYITAWKVAGPYEQAGKDGPALLAIPFPPEDAAKPVMWKPVPLQTGGGQPGIVDLDRVIGGTNRAAYLSAKIRVPQASDARLEIGSDDGVKAWLNGQLVHTNDAARPVTPGEDKVDVALKAGENTLLLKITQGAGGWGGCARFRTRDGKHIEGIEILQP